MHENASIPVEYREMGKGIQVFLFAAAVKYAVFCAEISDIGLFSICTDCGRIGADLGRVQKVVFNGATCLGAFIAESPAEIINAPF